MMHLNIRQRVLLVALAPVILVSLLLGIFFLAERIGDLHDVHAERARFLARQVASASEYGMFSRNRESLATIANSALREDVLQSVTILDTQSAILAQAGRVGFRRLPALSRSELMLHDVDTRHDLVLQPIWASQLVLDDLFREASGLSDQRALLGHVVLEISRERLFAGERRMLWMGLLVSGAGLGLGVLLAWRISRGVLQPIQRVTQMVSRIGQGDLAVRATVGEHDPLRELQLGLNQMALSLQRGREELEQRVTEATLELRVKKDEAEAATQAKSRFLAAASHDLRQPIHALGMFVARLAQLPHAPETSHLITKLDASVQAMQDLLEVLLDISRLEAGTLRVNAGPLAINDILLPMAHELQAEVQSRGLRLRVRPSSAWVVSDPVLLRRILLNLVSNAIQYTRQGGVLLACRLMPGAQRLRIEVWDTGIGIATEHQPFLFNEFFQVGNVERDRNKGLGLGLNIVDRTARLLGHPLRVCSIPGRGSRFSLELPLSQQVSVKTEESWPVSSLNGLRVLLIEDDHLSADALTDLLQSWGASVVQVASGQQARDYLVQSGQPDLIISDYRLPAPDNGLAIIQSLHRDAGCLIPACLISGDTDAGLMALAREAGLTLLHKPVRPAKLRSLIRHLIEVGTARSMPAETSM